MNYSQKPEKCNFCSFRKCKQKVRNFSDSMKLYNVLQLVLSSNEEIHSGAMIFISEKSSYRLLFSILFLPIILAKN